MRVKLSPDVVTALKKLKSKDNILSKKVEKKLEVFKKNPKHPSLRLHKLTGQHKNEWSISITRSIRMVYIEKEENIAYFIAIGTHDQVYKP